MIDIVPGPASDVIMEYPLRQWYSEVTTRVDSGQRFAGVYCIDRGGHAVLDALLVAADRVCCLRTTLYPDETGRLAYPSLTPEVPAAFWYERALFDLSDVTAVGHPRLDPLLLPRAPGQPSPRPGHVHAVALDRHVHSSATESRGPADVSGGGVFSLPLGPVRSGVFEAIEFLIETPGESIPHMNIRPHYKHRGIAKCFEGQSVRDGVLVAERVEGVASVAHALAFAHAVEGLVGAVPPRRARLLRVVYAELERITNHLDVVTRLCEAAGLAVAVARFGWHKEAVMRLLSAMCGNRFGRNVVCPGGLNADPRLEPREIWAQTRSIIGRVAADRRLLMDDSTFLDRVRGTGQLDHGLAAAHGALGPIGRASGCADDARLRPYDAYPELSGPNVAIDDRGDAQARLRVRLDEIGTAADLIGQACEHLSTLTGAPVGPEIDTAADGYALGWAEGPQGEVLYGLELRDGRVVRCFARSPALHNLLLFHDVFGHDIFTDFPFVEASFGLSYAGVAM